MTRGILFLTLGFVAAVLIACATATPSAPSAPSAIEYTRTGGIAGFNDRLTIDVKGHAVLSRRNQKVEFNVSDANLEQLYAAFQTARFGSIPENSMPKPVVPDGLIYALTYQGHTVKTSDGQVPPMLEPVLAALNRIVDSQGK